LWFPRRRIDALWNFLPLAIVLVLTGASSGQVPEPDGLWQGPMHSSTPNSLKGASVIDTDTFAELRGNPRAIVLDVSSAEKKPVSMPEDMPWMPIHRSIPGAVWLPGAGSGSADPTFETAFKEEIELLTVHDLDRPIVTFCHPQCWGSWNAGRRLVSLGYRHVYWYPEGFEGWQSKHDTLVVEEEPAWEAAIRAASLE
jgi:PQQ-dependent catabolism-associated CXXCW motif protein